MLVVCAPLLPGQSRPWDEAAEIQLAPRLAAAGIDRNDEKAMIRAIHNEKSSVAVAALWGLRYLPVSPAIIQELRLATNSADESILHYAGGTLAELGDREWTKSVLPRLPSIRRDAVLLDLCGALAKSGEYGGWLYIKEALVDNEETRAGRGLVHLRTFLGMRDATGQPVDLAEEISRLSQRMPPERLRRVQAEISRLRGETVH